MLQLQQNALMRINPLMKVHNNCLIGAVLGRRISIKDKIESVSW